MPKTSMDVMNDKLSTPILLKELHRTAKAMAKGKSPRPNGVIIEWFTPHFGKLLEKNYFNMINIAMKDGQLPKVWTKAWSTSSLKLEQKKT